ncbi:MAG: hypothetical protein FJW95_10275 [Actinobacteria bacterium]|nr:hypothetical protein [Actinomycetota bacterium]
MATLAVPAAIAYDPYAWLVWGREIGRWQLDTTGGPSWKPLPVVGTALVAPFGGWAPALWLVVARTGALLAIVGTYRVAARLVARGAVGSAGRAASRWAGAVAVGALVLSPDPGPRYVRLYLEGHSAPLTAALTVWAIDRHLDGRHGAALVLGGLLALDRPEAWPFLAAYAVWVWRRDRRLRALVASVGIAVPALWFGPDWWGSGSPLNGADSARVLTDDTHRALDGLRRVAETVIAPAWVAAGAAVVDGWRRRDRIVLGLAAGAAGWFVLVVAMGAALGYAALSRFLLPGAVVVCVLAGVGAVRVAARLRSRRAQVVAVVVLVVLVAPAVVWRATGIVGQVDDVVTRDHQVDDLDAAITAAGGDLAVEACGRIAARDAGVPRVALAWKLDVPMADVATRPGRVPGTLFVPRPPAADSAREARRVARRTGGAVEVAAVTRHWLVYRIDCEPGAGGGQSPGVD